VSFMSEKKIVYLSLTLGTGKTKQTGLLRDFMLFAMHIASDATNATYFTNKPCLSYHKTCTTATE
jgi:hypothetical protein